MFAYLKPIIVLSGFHFPENGQRLKGCQAAGHLITFSQADAGLSWEAHFRHDDTSFAEVKLGNKHGVKFEGQLGVYVNQSELPQVFLRQGNVRMHERREQIMNL